MLRPENFFRLSPPPPDVLMLPTPLTTHTLIGRNTVYGQYGPGKIFSPPPRCFDASCAPDKK